MTGLAAAASGSCKRRLHVAASSPQSLLRQAAAEVWPCAGCVSGNFGGRYALTCALLLVPFAAGAGSQAASTPSTGSRPPRRLASALRPRTAGGVVAGSSRPGASPGRDDQEIPVGAKRLRLCEAGGPSSELSPAGHVGADTEETVFSRVGIRESVKNTVAAWEEQDIDEAPRRDAALGARGRGVAVGRQEPDLCSPLVADSRPLAGHCSVSNAAAATDEHGSALLGTCGASLSVRAVVDHAPATQRPLSLLAATQSWTVVFGELVNRGMSTFVSGAPGVGKTSFLSYFAAFLRSRLTSLGAVVVVAPTGSATKTAKGVTYHSFFGFSRSYKM
eukprot:TRINITY_DN5940_c0_g1_i1.p1 TRINITY_DN5940_c0_g1~~TRINITY_DN5940_c0_g1_i1.p1  ORF type:complete len:333 (+),score=25.73 TRINITY_DN5940_c0_g1_i1:542-1540(+)